MDWKICVGLLLLVCSVVVADGFPELCPCLPIKLCPRIYGANPEDRKYLGEFLKCPVEEEVRCCGASVSSTVTAQDESKTEEDNYLIDNEIEDVRMEHLTIPPVTTEEPEIPTTTTEEYPETTTTEMPIETTTTELSEETTTTEMPVEDVTLPRFGKGVEFIYAARGDLDAEESQRKGKKLPFDTEEDNVFVIMPQQFLEDETFNEIVDATTQYPTTAAQHSNASEAVTTTEAPVTATTIISDTTTRRPRIKKRIRVKVRKGFHLLPRIHPNDLALEDTETTTKENTRNNRDLDEKMRKINHALYARRRHVLEMKNTITTTEAVAAVVDTTPVSTVPVTESTPMSVHQNPAILMLLNSNASKRKSYFNRRLQPQPKEPANTKPTSTTTAAESRNSDSESSKLEGQHQKMIEQVARAVQQESMMSTFDIADELMDPEMAVRIGSIQKMLAEEIMQRILTRIGVQPRSAAAGGKVTTTTTSTSAPPLLVATENPIDSPESKSPEDRPYRGSKRYIDTNFLNAYENVIHKVEEKIKTHKTKTRGKYPESKTTTTTTEKSSPPTDEPNVQHLVNSRRKIRPWTKTSKTTASPSPLPIEAPVTEAPAPELETITEIIKELEKIQEETIAEFKPSRLWEYYTDVTASGQDTTAADVLSEPIDLLGRSPRELLHEGFVPIPNAQTSNIQLPLAEQLVLPSLERSSKFDVNSS